MICIPIVRAYLIRGQDADETFLGRLVNRKPERFITRLLIEAD